MNVTLFSQNQESFERPQFSFHQVVTTFIGIRSTVFSVKTTFFRWLRRNSLLSARQHVNKRILFNLLYVLSNLDPQRQRFTTLHCEEVTENLPHCVFLPTKGLQINHTQMFFILHFRLRKTTTIVTTWSNESGRPMRYASSVMTLNHHGRRSKEKNWHKHTEFRRT